MNSDSEQMSTSEDESGSIFMDTDESDSDEELHATPPKYSNRSTSKLKATTGSRPLVS